MADEHSHDSSEPSAPASGDAADAAPDADDTPGTTKPAGPPGAKKPDGPPGAKKPDGPPGAKKPDGPPGAKKPDGPPSATKPAGPPGAKKPAGPPGSKKPGGSGKMPPGFGGNGGGTELTRKDFASDQDVRWCPGCGDYAILATVQRLLPDLGVKKENQVFVSGIGCAGRFPYYMDTYGMHTIHGRAPAIATGLKSANPELDVWIVTGDGDALSIGGNHLIHVLRRNVDTQILLFNNKIYGLTKGQYSPTSEQGKVTKSTPHGSIDRPFNPVSVALGADASFVARTMDRDPQHMKAMMRASYEHPGTGFLEIYQNCNIFNDGAFFEFTEKETKDERSLFVEDGEPLTFDNGSKGVRLDGLTPQAVDLDAGRWSVDDCLVYDETSREMATLIGRIFWEEDLPRPFGVLYRDERPTYDQLLHDQLDAVTEEKGEGALDALLHEGDTWEIE
jgi:2-oxoglutarate ferredoxin oxidoreductase subunit beta